MENVFSLESQHGQGVAVTGEVIYESLHRGQSKSNLKPFIHRAIERRLAEIPDALIWASYLVIFSPGQDEEEVRCQVDVETDGERAGFAIGYGRFTHQAFHDAVERLQWYEKNTPQKMSV